MSCVEEEKPKLERVEPTHINQRRTFQAERIKEKLESNKGLGEVPDLSYSRHTIFKRNTSQKKMPREIKS